MIEASRLGAEPVAQEVRRGGTVRDRGEEFGIALEAQISAAETARELQSVNGRAAAAMQSNIDPTFVAVEQLASRSENVAGGLKSEVQDEMNSVKGEGDAVEADVGRGKDARSFVHRENSSAASAAANPKETTAEPGQMQSVIAAGSVAAAQGGTGKGEPAAHVVKYNENYGKTPENAMGASGDMAPVVATVALGRTGSGNDNSSGTGRNSQVSAVEALGALGRKTAFKVVVAERAPNADMDKFVAQTAKALAAAVKREGGTIVMRMNPENLGLLKVRVETKAGSVNARVEASESSARQLLIDDVESLRSALEAHGVCVEKIEIVRMDDLQGLNAESSRGSGTDQGSGSELGNSGRQAEDRQRDGTERRDAMRGFEETASEFMDEPAGVYLCGVELRVDAIA